MGDIITQHYLSANSYKFSSSFIISLTVQCHIVVLWRRCKLSQLRESQPAIQQSQLHPLWEPLCGVPGPLSQPGDIESHRTSPFPQSKWYQPVKKKYFNSVILNQQVSKQGCHNPLQPLCRLANSPRCLLVHVSLNQSVF